MSSSLLVIILLVIVCIFVVYLRMQNKTVGEFFGRGEEQTTQQRLVREYKRWYTIRCRLDNVKASLTEKQVYELRNVIERWCLSTQNKLKDSDEINKKMRQEILDKKIAVPKTIDRLMKRINTEVVPPEPEGIVCIIDSDDMKIIRFDQYEREFASERIDLLRKIATEKLGSSSSVDDLIALCSMRYSSLMPAGNQWNIPAEVYRHLVTNYGIEVEGFASPFNSQIIPVNPKLHFCSLFPDTDTLFGSVGSFFEYDFLGKVAIVNPPYVIDIMDSAADKVMDTILRAEKLGKPTRIFVTVPDWKDAHFYCAMGSFRLAEHIIKLEPYKYYYEDSNNGGKRIKSPFPSTMFIMSYGYPRIEDIGDIVEAFRWKF
jgi:hypothetical protein